LGKTQEPFGFEAQAGRERIEKARRFRYEETDSVESALRGHEYALLRNATSTELETYVAAEEAMTVCQLKQRGIIKAAGMRGKVWEDEETGKRSCMHSLIIQAMNFTGIGPIGMLLERRLRTRKFLCLRGFTNNQRRGVYADRR